MKLLMIRSSQQGRCSLDVAIEKGQTDIVDVLLNHGANVDTIDMVRNL